MRRVLICLAALCTATAGSWLFVRFYGPASDAAIAWSSATDHQLQWVYPTEQTWIVDEVAEAIVNLGRPLTDSRASRPATGNVVVTSLPEQGGLARFAVKRAAGQEISVAVQHHIWAAATYAPITAAVLGSVSASEVEVVASEPGGGIVSTLTSPRPAVIQQENARVSGLLRANPRSAGAHDEAALVLAALAMRESAGVFSDPRRIMSRMTAHLAVSTHLGGSLSPAGRLADAVLLTLAGRQREALERVGELEKLPEPGIRAWSRALRLRNTNDWRATRSGRGLSLLEQLETLRAIQTTLGSDRALDFYESAGRPAGPTDWSRAMMQWGWSVEAGNHWPEAVEAELAEARAIRAAFGSFDDSAARDVLIRELNVEAGLGPISGSSVDPLWVIDWGTWAAASQRHLVMQVQAVYRHWHDKLGLPDDAKRFEQEAEKTLSSLTMFPLLRPYLAYDRATYDRAVTAASEVCRRRPELVTDLVWKRLFEKLPFAVVSDATPPSGPWFTPLVPAGTAFDAGDRAFGPSSERRVNREEIARLRELSPYRRQLVIEAVRQQHGNTPAYTVLQKEYGEPAAYDLVLARRIARAAAGTPDAYVPLMRRVGDLNPESLVELGTHFLDRGKASEAREVYEEWVARSRDTVHVSNSAWWLVRHYHETGERRKADALARRVAEVHSYWGLVTLADLYDWRGETAEAKTLYETAAKRYNNDSERLAFYLRRANRHSELKADADSLTPRIFPKGLERVNLRGVTSAPADGVSLLEVGASGVRSGLRKNDVVVGVDGIRVRNVRQYRVARGAGDAPDLKFLVWRDIGYLEVTVPFRYGWPVSNLRDYQPQKP